MLNKKWIFTGLASSLLIVSACGDMNDNEDNHDDADNNEEAAGEGGEIEIGLNNWAENIAVSNMWKVLLEEEGYDVELTLVEKAPIFAGVAAGDIDLSLEIWLPTTDEPYYEEYQDEIDFRDEHWFEGTGLGLVVPEYLDIDSIEELNEHAEEFDNQIIGIDAGASLSRLTEEVIEDYGLDLELMVSSEPAMMTELDTAYQQEEPVVVTLWNPHWAFSDYDLKYLDDPQGSYGEPEDIFYMARQGFEDDYPEVLEWLDNWYMDDETLGELMSVINELDDEEEGARQWVDENRDLTDEWMDN